MSGELAKDVYEDLVILQILVTDSDGRMADYFKAVEDHRTQGMPDRSYSAALERVVDHLLRGALGTSDQTRKAVVQGATKFQNVYYPIKDPEEGK